MVGCRSGLEAENEQDDFQPAECSCYNGPSICGGASNRAKNTAIRFRGLTVKMVRSGIASSAARRATSSMKSVRFLPSVLAARSIRFEEPKFFERRGPPDLAAGRSRDEWHTAWTRFVLSFYGRSTPPEGQFQSPKPTSILPSQKNQHRLIDASHVCGIEMTDAGTPICFLESSWFYPLSALRSR